LSPPSCRINPSPRSRKYAESCLATDHWHAGPWTPEKARRLRALVERAHANGLWIRFYTLDGSPASELSCRGWFRGYNFGSLQVARERWQAAIKAGVDYIASDQYELLGKEVRRSAERR